MAIAYARDPGFATRPDLGMVTTVITLDGSYSAGGYAIDNPSIGMIGTPGNMDLTYVHATATNDFVPVWDKANGKIKIFKSGTANATLNECAAGDITSGHSIIATAHGVPRL